MDKGCIHTYKGVEYRNYQDLKNALIEEQSSHYFAPFMAAVLEKLKNNPDITGVQEIEKVVKEISDQFMLKEDVSLTLSQLLSAATDNAKELILAKINAGPETAGVYAYLTMLGVPFKEIAQMMKSDAVKWVIENSRKNIFDKQTDFNSIKSSIKEFENGPNVYKYLDFDRANIFSNILRDSLKNSTFLGALPYGNIFKDPEVIKILSNTDKKKGPVVKMHSIGALMSPIDITSKVGDTIVTKSLDFNISREDISEFYKTLQEGNFIKESYEPVVNKYTEDEDMDMGWEDGEIRSNKIPVKIEVSRFIQKMIEYLDKAPEGDISEFANIMEDSKEVLILGRMLSINQGIKTDSYSQYAFFQRVTDYIIEKSKGKMSLETPEKMMSEMMEEMPTHRVDPKFLEEVMKRFDFKKFLGIGLTQEDATIYRETSKLWYNKIKSSFNILAIVSDTPHFNAMLGVSSLMENMKSMLSVKAKLVDKLIKDVYDKHIIASDLTEEQMEYKTIADKDYFKIMDFANDSIILKWIRSLDDSKRIFAHDSNTYHTIVDNKIVKVTEENRERYPRKIDVSSAEGRLDFIDMVHEMMSVLKDGKFLVNGEYKEHPLLKNNAFIHSFDIDKKRDPLTGKNNKFYKLPMNILNVNEANTHKFNSYLIGFSDLAKIEYNGVNIQNLLFLYNTFIHRDKINRDSLTKLFESSTSGIEHTMMGDFIKWAGDFDWNEKELQSLSESKEYDYDIDDIIIKGLATKIFSKNLDRNVGKYAYAVLYNASTGESTKQYYEWNNSASTYQKYDHFSSDLAIASSAGSQIGVQRGNANDFNATLREISNRGIIINNVKIEC